MTKPTDEEFLRVTVCEGKYTYVQDSKGSRVLRYNEALRDCTGDGFILSLARHIQAQADENDKLQARVQELERSVPSAPPCKCRSCADFIPEGAMIFNKPLLSDMCGHVDYQSNLHTRSVCGGYLSMTTHNRSKAKCPTTTRK